MKKILLILLLCLTTIACGKTGLPNPYIEVSSMEEASEMAGFNLEAPATFKGYKKRVIKVIKDNTIEVTFHKEETSPEGLFIRKIKTTYDNKNVETIKIGNYDVRLKIDGEYVSLATWTDGTYSYVVNPNGAKLNLEEITNLILSIK